MIIIIIIIIEIIKKGQAALLPSPQGPAPQL